MYIFPKFLKYSHLCQSGSPGIKSCWASCSYAYCVTKLWRHHRVPRHHALFLATIGCVAHDASWKEILATDVILDIRILMCSGRIDKAMHRRQTLDTWQYIYRLLGMAKCVQINVFFLNFILSGTICDCNDPSRCRLTSVVDASNPLVGKFGRNDMGISSGKLSITLHLPAGKSCWFKSIIPNVLIHGKWCSSYSYQ